MEEVAKVNMAIWLKTVKGGNPVEVASLYSDKAVFLPTVSGDLKLGQEGARDYFRHFLAKDPVGRIVDEEVIELGPDSYLHAGMYDFELTEDGQRIVVEARFSYIWKMEADGWKIQHHHSSLKPA